MSTGPRTGVAALGAAAAAVAAAPAAYTRAATRGRRHHVSADAFAPADAALVLGARVWPDGRPSRFLRQRVDAGVALLERGLVHRVILSGAGANREGLDETAAMLSAALDAGADRGLIDLDPDGVNTAASAANAAARPDVASVIVCTQEFHLPRAVWLCDRAGLATQGAYPDVLTKRHTGIGYLRELPATWKAVLGR